MKTLPVMFWVVLLVLVACHPTSTPPVAPVAQEPQDTEPPPDLIPALAQWCWVQPEPVVIFIKQTYGGMGIPLAEDLITNIRTPVLCTEEYTYKLWIDSTAVEHLIQYLSDRNIVVDTRKITVDVSLDSMRTLLADTPLDFRFMHYDSVCVQIAGSLLEWAQYQRPKQVLYFGFHDVIARNWCYSIPAGPPYVNFRCLQNLHYLMRDLPQTTREQFVTSIDTSLTFEQLQSLLSPLGQLTQYNAMYGDY